MALDFVDLCQSCQGCSDCYPSKCCQAVRWSYWVVACHRHCWCGLEGLMFMGFGLFRFVQACGWKICWCWVWWHWLQNHFLHLIDLVLLEPVKHHQVQCYQACCKFHHEQNRSSIPTQKCQCSWFMALNQLMNSKCLKIGNQGLLMMDFFLQFQKIVPQYQLSSPLMVPLVWNDFQFVHHQHVFPILNHHLLN